MLNKYKAEEIAKPRYIIIKLLKTSDEEKILEATGGKHASHIEEQRKRMTAEFSLETLPAVKQCNDAC